MNNIKGTNKPILAIGDEKMPKRAKIRKKRNDDSPEGGNLPSGTIMFVLLTSLAISFVAFNKLAYVSNTFEPFQNDSFPLEPVLGNDFWSSLISGHYFGLRSAHPNSTVVSFMWFRNRIEANGLPILHWCDLNDRVKDYVWNYNDLKNFGHQTINDPYLSINTSFIRFGNNSVRAKLQFKAPNMQDSYSVILYSAAESKHEQIKAENLEKFDDLKVFTINGKDNLNGKNFKIRFNIAKGQSLMKSFLTKQAQMNSLKETVIRNLYVFPEKNNPSSKFYAVVNGLDYEVPEDDINFISYQVVFRKELEVDIEIILDEAEYNKDIDYDKELQSMIEKFNADFESKFPLKKHADLTDEMVRFARATLSSTIGGISYFYGESVVRDDNNMKVGLYGPMQLLTAVPSRTTFPRGFLWDEGFIQLLISAWDPELSMAVIKSWFNIMNRDGWIPREVILGDEARDRVPAEFLMQYNSNANPPSMLLVVEALIDSNTYNKDWLEHLFPRIKLWFDWFNTTQAGVIPTTFRWRGRNATIQTELNPKTLTSGLDDFPRATNPTDNEYHVDLRCWMALASRVIAKIAKILGNDSQQLFSDFYEALRDNKKLEQLHWNEQEKMFSDYGLHSRNVSLERVPVSIDKEVVMRVFHEPPKYGFVPDLGYIALFPFITQLLDADNQKLAHVLDSIEDPNKLWTPFGLRSTSKDSFYYMKYNTEFDAPYWRGHVWINMNYLTLKSLRHYSQIEGPFKERCKKIYTRLRKNIVLNMFQQYQKTGFVWEHYDDSDGIGRGTRPFTGWSALIVRIMGERY